MALTCWRHKAVQAGVLVALFGCALSTDCPDTWVAFEGSCYLFGTDTPLNFFDAEHYCRQHGGHLVHVDNSIENAFIKNFLGSLKPADHWMGLTDERVEGVWVWYDTNSTPNFTDWLSGQPNNYLNKEDCAHFDAYHNYQWNDLQCSDSVEPICEIRRANSEVVVG